MAKARIYVEWRTEHTIEVPDGYDQHDVDKDFECWADQDIYPINGEIVDWECTHVDESAADETEPAETLSRPDAVSGPKTSTKEPTQ